MTDLIRSVIVVGTRTPMGRLLGSLKDLSGSDLGAIAIRGALAKACVGPELVQYVIMGQVLTAGAGQIPARQAAVAAGIPMGVPALTINKVRIIVPLPSGNHRQRSWLLTGKARTPVSGGHGWVSAVTT
jgi:acetyl-CoA C-acetyltransferase